MVNLLQVTCFILVLSMIHGWDSASDFGDSSFPKFIDTAEIKKKLEDVEPECTTTGNSPSTTTCYKELIVDGIKYESKEVTVTDDQGNISRSNNYQSSSYNTNSNTRFSNMND
jgi:hypothetical protein